MSYTATISRTGGYRPTGAAWRESHPVTPNTAVSSKEDCFNLIIRIGVKKAYPEYVKLHFQTYMRLMFQCSGDLTAKQLKQVKRIQERLTAAFPNQASSLRSDLLDQYIASRRKFTGAVKSGLVALANRLTKTMTRKEAFIEAWKLFKAGSVKIPVAGVTFGRRQEALARLQQYPQKDIHCVLVPEPENEFDKDAVAVMAGVQNGKGLFCIGYVPRTETGKVKALTAAGKKPALKVICAETNSAQLSLDL